MLRTFAVAFSIVLAACQSSMAAPWALPPGVKTITVNGYPMAYLESGTGEPVVLVHGGGTDYRTWRQLTAAPPRGFRLIAVSLRHYYPERWDGKGDKFSIVQHAADLAAFMEVLGVGQVYLVAHSRGGSVGVKAALTRPALVKKLVLMEGQFYELVPKPTSGEGEVQMDAVRKAIRARFEQGDIDGGLELYTDRDTPGSWSRRPEASRQRTRENAWTLIADGPVNPIACADVAALQMPVLLVQGEKTPRRFASIVDATHKCLPSAQRATIPDAGHAMHFDTPAAFEAALVKFLSD